MNIYPVILTGGAGSRLWPLSREYFPKPLLPLVGDRTLLQESALRLEGLDAVQPPLFVCNEEHRFLVAEQVQEIGQTPTGILLEPEGRNTAPALTIAALALVEKSPEAVMVVMPADHVIPDRERFQGTVAEGIALAEQGFLVTFGIVPDRPETGYGYIRRGQAIDDSPAFAVAQFVEKPDQATAEEYLASGEFLWNSGIFVMRADRWLEEIGRFRPEILAACEQAVAGGRSDIDFCRVGKEAFLSSPSDSIDYAVMEKTDHAAVVPMATEWSDVGAWSAIWDISLRDEQDNVTQGDVLTHEVRGSLILAQDRCVAAVGLEDMVIVETSDAILVAPKDRDQDVKAIVAQLKAADREEHRFHSRVYRPWGDYEGIDLGDRYQVKRLTVKPGASLSLQLHHHRAEHWIVVSGTARVTKGDEVFILTENESTYIPLGTTHRLENPGTIPLEIIEVQSGSYLGEDDIVRFEDVYDRVQ
ncbi:mannose-1-phosphate guanylyltransferase/mannose-6-phosphate isomerase [Thiohalobacter sp. IOR34]|uniref:mannose-1-phosphate guanylyltransferase/mannose-6-phosphate isomerase n=1 Tax=Thiohalobacter sp. IOR34 TaxID=3057176 RepID=UPI0025AFCBA3|nr:mannose-1-phosphate guanylyltransferase/mannose-6-phosphate isomerase [Thiohalobacter sp. IOR34]WJW76697.1 mannose-1-phosphate guanylyltransferase/mannose-6-phosphate isomerase [Thiohalobacter sp. IOR34]